MTPFYTCFDWFKKLRLFVNVRNRKVNVPNVRQKKKCFHQLCIIFTKKQHGARPCVEKMQLIFFVPPNEELEIAPPKIWMSPQK